MDHPEQILSARTPRGFTLIEAVMATAIMAVMLIVVAQVSVSLGAISVEESNEVQMQTDVRRAVSEMIFLIEESRPVALWRENQIAAELPHIAAFAAANDGPTDTDWNKNGDSLDRGMFYTFTVPLKRINGQPLTAPNSAGSKIHGEVAYGVGEMGEGLQFLRSDLAPAMKENTYTIFFMPDGTQLSEVTENVDIDGNGTATDIFIYGGLYISNDQKKEIRQITGRIALRRFAATQLAADYPGAYHPETNNGRDFDHRGKVFALECEDFKDTNDNGVYDNEIGNDALINGGDANTNLLWDVKMFVRFYFPIIRDDPVRGKVSRLRALDTRINYFRNTIEAARQ